MFSVLHYNTNSALHYQRLTSSLTTHDIISDAYCHQRFITISTLYRIINANLNRQRCIFLNDELDLQRCITLSPLHYTVNAVLHPQRCAIRSTLHHTVNAALVNKVDASKNSITQSKVTSANFVQSLTP